MGIPGRTRLVVPGGEVECQPAPLGEFIERWEEREYWAAHEVLEDAWRVSGSAFYQGLILLASAWVHAARGNPHGIDAQLRKALARLDGLPSPYLGIDLDVIRRTARWLRAWVSEISPEAPVRPDIRSRSEATRATDWWRHRIPHLTVGFEPSRVRGDEPELTPV